MDTITQLAKTLGSFRAENLGEELFSLYTRPAYFPKLLTAIPCLLQGGRGTGKTTVLKSLSYQGQFQLAGNNVHILNKLDFIGLYYKLETGLVSAFTGAEQNEDFWKKIFSHFINLQLCKLICECVIWYETVSENKVEVNAQELDTFCRSLGLNCQLDFESIRITIENEIAVLESNLNFASDAQNLRFTPIGGPIRRLVKTLRCSTNFSSKIFYFLFDEYENLHEYQQAILNTFLKQADSELTFKIGIKELGLKTKKTLNPNEQLVDPADYVLVDVSHKEDEFEFDDFAKSVFKSRFILLQQKGIMINLNVANLFEDLSEEAEAIKLGGEIIAEDVSKEIEQYANNDELHAMRLLSIQELVLINFFAQSENKTIYSVFKEAVTNSAIWTNRVNNYGYASLFTIRKKRVGISKYYSGWKTFLSLSAGNIRYLLQLVTNSLIEHVKNDNSLDKKISATCQTEVASEVGKKNLLELEGLSTSGAQLMKLVLALGQVFHEMAIQAEGHAPEINQFEVSMKCQTETDNIEKVNVLLHSAVMHLALIRTSGTKLGKPGDTRDFDYTLHPIFAPFFVYSHRRKRKFSILPEEILGLINSPSLTIKSLLHKQNRNSYSELPEQLELFGGFYERGY